MHILNLIRDKKTSFRKEDIEGKRNGKEFQFTKI